MIFLSKKSITLKLWLFFWVSIYILIYSFNTGNGDYFAYESFYYNREFFDWGWEFLYGLISDYFKYQKFNFFEFKFFVSILTMVILIKSIVGFSPKPILFLFLFLFFFFPLDYVLIRNFLAFSIVLMGFKEFYSAGRFDGHIKFFFYIIVASFFHQSSVIFLFFIFAKTKKLSINFLTIMLILFFIFFFFIKFFLLNYEFYSHRVDIYSGNINGKFLVILSYVFNFLLFYFAFYKLKVKNNESLKVKNFILNCNAILFFVMIVNLDIPIIWRILRYMVFVNLVFLSIFLKSNMTKFNLRMMFVFFAALTTVFLGFIVPVWSDTAGSFLNNLLID